MTLRIHDLPKTTRRGRDDELPRLFPRLLTDTRLDPRISVAIRFLETHVGRTRGAVDGTSLLDLFGDARLARCLTTCLGQSYRYTARHFEDVLNAEQVATLTERGLNTPADLRALTYERANLSGGFVRPLERRSFLEALVPGLSADDVERVLWLDALDQAVLVRVGPTPTPAEVRAHFNLRVLEAVLAGAVEVELGRAGDDAYIGAVAERHAVACRIDDGLVRLVGRADDVGSWVRHGARLARVAITLLATGALGAGQAIVMHRGERHQVVLDRTWLRRALPSRAWVALPEQWEPLEQLLQKGRQRGVLAGWRLQRWPAPMVTDSGVVWAEFALTRGPLSIGVLPLPERLSPVSAGGLAALARRRACLFVASGTVPASLAEADVLAGDGDAAVAELGAMLSRRWLAASGAPSWLTALSEATHQTGSLTEAELAQRLDCDEAQVGARLARLPTAGFQYIPGFGVCTPALLEQAGAVVREEVAGNNGRLELLRVGRRLQALIGHGDGLHALIGYLAGEVRLVA